MWWTVIALMCALVSQAAADDKANLAAARKILDRQFVGDLDWAPPMTKDHFGVVPGHFSDGEIINWRFGPPYIGKTTFKTIVAGWSGNWGWIAADLSISQRPYTPSDGAKAKEQIHRYHLVQVYELEGKEVKVKATFLADTMDDAKLPVVQHAPGGPPKAGSLVWHLVMPGKAKLLANPNVAVLGTSAGEAALGQVPAKKLLGTWGKLELSVAGNKEKELVSGDLGVAFAEVDLLVNKTSRRLRAIVVAKKVATGWEVAALGFGTDTPVGDPTIP